MRLRLRRSEAYAIHSPICVGGSWYRPCARRVSRAPMCPHGLLGGVARRSVEPTNPVDMTALPVNDPYKDYPVHKTNGLLGAARNPTV